MKKGKGEAKDVSQMSDHEVMIAYMRAALAGTVPLTPVQAALAAATQPVVVAKREDPKPDEETDAEISKRTKVCPKCGKTGNVGRDFGLKTIRGYRYPQSYCYECRAGLNYNAKPKRYNTKRRNRPA